MSKEPAPSKLAAIKALREAQHSAPPKPPKAPKLTKAEIKRLEKDALND